MGLHGRLLRVCNARGRWAPDPLGRFRRNHHESIFLSGRKKQNRQNWRRFRPFCGAAIWILSQDWQLYGGTNSVCDSHSQFRHFAPQLQNEFPVQTPISERAVLNQTAVSSDGCLGSLPPGGSAPLRVQDSYWKFRTPKAFIPVSSRVPAESTAYWYVQADSGTVRYNAAPEPN